MASLKDLLAMHLGRRSLVATGVSKWPGGQTASTSTSALSGLRSSSTLADPLRQLVAGKLKTSLFLEEFDPLRQFQLAGGGGVLMHEMLHVRALLALRQLHDLAD